MEKWWVSVVDRKWKRDGEGNFWIGVWMRENGGERGKFMEEERERVGEQLNFKLFQISNYEREFHKIYINRRRERIFQPLKGCVSSRGATFFG